MLERARGGSAASTVCPARGARVRRDGRALLLTFILVNGLLAATGCESAIVGGAKCGAGFTRCGDECVNLKRDFRNCGECGNLCPGFICLKGECEEPAPDQPDASSSDASD